MPLDRWVHKAPRPSYLASEAYPVNRLSDNLVTGFPVVQVNLGDLELIAGGVLADD